MNIQSSINDLRAALENILLRSCTMHEVNAAWEVKIIESKISLVLLGLDITSQTNPQDLNFYLEQLEHMPLDNLRAIFTFDEISKAPGLDDEKLETFLRKVMHALTIPTAHHVETQLHESNLRIDELYLKYYPEKRKKMRLTHECSILLSTCFSSLKDQLSPEYYQKISKIKEKIKLALEPFIQSVSEKTEISDATEMLSTFKPEYDSLVEEGQKILDIDPGIWEKQIQPVLDTLCGLLIKLVANFPPVALFFPSLNAYGDTFFKPKQTKEEAVSVWNERTQESGEKIYNIFQPVC
ncbi:MAG: hypothetical protein P1U39_07735 [Legionellaceae bacterium]|nr:hypothetical protein [Legionellaceae bacterium]